MICTICMLISPMSAMAADVLPLETELETSEDETRSEVETESEVETTSETEETTETTEIDETESDESVTEDESPIVGKVGAKASKVTMITKNANTAGDTIDISTCSEGIIIDSTNYGEYDYKTITGTSSPENNIIISGGVTVHLTIDDLVIDKRECQVGNYRYAAIEIKENSTLYLTIKGDNVLKGGNLNGGAGICVEGGNTLVITEESDGKITAVGGNGSGSAAGIGSGNCGYAAGGQESRNPSLGTIEINGGIINATGGESYYGLDVVMASAGIGLSGMGQMGSGSITINGGTVTATGGKSEGAGIGGGSLCYVGNISINGGTVTANVATYKSERSGAAAIGCGFNGGKDKLSCGEISINGGTVNTNGNIGYGSSYYEDGFTGGFVEITNGATVTITEGEVICETKNVDNEGVTKKYEIKVTVKDSAYTEGTKSGNITIGEGTRAFSKDIEFNLGNGQATASFEMETTLSGEQTVKVKIDGTALEDKKIKLGIDNEVIYGAEQGFSLAAVSGVTTDYGNGVLKVGGSGSLSISMATGVETTTDRIVIENGADVKLELKNLSIDTTEKQKGAITIGQTGGTAKCEIIPVGENSLTREDGLAEGVIEVGDGSSLTISGSGKLTIKSKATETTEEPYSYSTGIYAFNGKVVIKDNPVIDICATGDTDDKGYVLNHMTCIYSTDITIDGGHINMIASRSGHGMGYPHRITWDTASYDVTINGGTIYAEGGKSNDNNGGITNQCTRAVINGGNVNMNKLNGSLPEKLKHPVNSKDVELYCTIITVGDADDNGKNTLSKNAKVEALTIKYNDNNYSYGTDGMCTDNKGKLYLWLPEGSVVSKVVTENATYTGECTTNADCKIVNLQVKGNCFGTAEATFTLAEGSEFHNFTKKDKNANTLKTPGTCTKKAVYYYTCEDCGAISTDKTFEGETDPNNHVNTEIRDAKEAVHKTQTDGYTGDKYCKDCGKKLEQGTAIKATAHTPASEWMHDDTEHWKKCTVENCDAEISGSRKSHSSTGEHKATCQKKATCDVCGATYGEKISCDFRAKVKSDEALKTPATATEGAVYYYSCSMCGKVEKNDEHTFVEKLPTPVTPTPVVPTPEEEPTPTDHTSEDSSSEDSAYATLAPAVKTSVAPALVATVPNGNQTLKGDVSTGNRQMTEDTKQDNAGEQTASEEVEQSQTDAIQNIVPITDEKQTQGNITVNEKASDVTDSDAAQEKSNMRRIAIVSSAIAGSTVACGGVFFFFRRKRLLEKILKSLFKK